MRIKDKKEKVAAYVRKIDPRHKEKTVDQMEETIEDLMEEIKALENEIKNSQLLKESDSQKTTIDISPACTLKKVTDHETRENRNGKIVNVTRLYFEEDVPIRTMDQWADKNGTITELAKQMIGKKVRTTVWKPETYNALRWWNNIHEVGDTFDEAEN